MAEFAYPSAWLDSYGVSIKEALERASRDGYCLTHANTARPDFSPTELGSTGRRQLVRYLEGLGLRLSALATCYSGAGLADPGRADERLERLRETLELARSLSVRTAVANIGGLSNTVRAGLAAGILEYVADLADRVGVSVAIEASGDRFGDLADAVARIGCPALRLAVDSAAVSVDELSAAAERGTPVGALILRDARRVGDQFEETPLGEGEVDLAGWLGAAAAAGPSGPMTVRLDPRRVGVDGMARAREHVEFLLRGSTGPR